MSSYKRLTKAGQKMKRSAVVQEALREYLPATEIHAKEERDRKGYLRHPEDAAYLALWDAEAVWPS